MSAQIFFFQGLTEQAFLSPLPHYGYIKVLGPNRIFVTMLPQVSVFLDDVTL